MSHSHRAQRFLKDAGFAEEREWRLIRLGASFEDPSPRFRVGQSMLVPFQEHRFSTAKQPIIELMVGPTPHPQLARSAVQSVLISKGLGRADIRTSAIPYRAW